MVEVLGCSGWHRACSGPQRRAEKWAGSAKTLPSSKELKVSVFLSGPQNGWNDPPALNRAAKKKKVL